MRWKFHGFPTVSGDPQIPERRVFRAKLNTQLLRTYEQMIDNHTSRHEQVSVTQQCVRCHRNQQITNLTFLYILMIQEGITTTVHISHHAQVMCIVLG